MKEALSFFINPKYLKTVTIDWRRLLLIAIVYIIISSPLNFINHLLIRTLSLNEKEINENFFRTFIMLAVFAPVFEEITFRLLLKPKKRNLIVFATSALTVSILFFLGNQLLLMSVLLFAGTISSMVIFNKKILHAFQKFFLKKFVYFFYFSCIIFGFVHIFNYEPVGIMMFVLSPLIVAPAVLAGIFFGYVRMKFGIMYSILFHACINLLSLSNFFNN
ncbi:MAG TPA: CPBP family glutamic-type intramembrane protease [Bacteroidales bacterium]|nr:CPBP family glutamic-type intramembrane protease [Bacteroidales bacterium]